MWPNEMAHALVRAVSKLVSTPPSGADSLSGEASARVPTRHVRNLRHQLMQALHLESNAAPG
jgi:hypothetical protein